MRTLTSTLQAAAQSASAEPAITVSIAPRIDSIRRLRWESVYAGAEPDKPHALAVAGDGAALRARTVAGSPNDALAYQRLANPGPGSAWGSWASIESVGAGTGVALAALGSQALLAFVDPGLRQVRVRESSDNGQTWGAGVVAAATTADAQWVAIAVKPSGVVTLAYTTTGGVLWVVQRTSGVWGSPGAWPHATTSLGGVALHAGFDYYVVVAGVGSDGHTRVWTLVYGDGGDFGVGAWSSLVETARGHSGSQVTFAGPSLALPDTLRLGFSERYAGPVAYDRPLLSFAPAFADFWQGLWREPAPPFDASSAHGLALASGGGRLWATNAAQVWRASLTTAPLDVSADVTALNIEVEPERGRLTLALRNDHGRYTGPGSGDLAVWTLGAEVEVGLGYRTSVGVETVLLPHFWLDGWEHRHGDGSATVVLSASDAWGLLDAWRARRTYLWSSAANTASQVLTFLLARAGLSLSTLSASASFVNESPAFVVHAGQSGAEAVRDLLARFADLLFFRQEGAALKEPTAGEATTYTYGVAHALRGTRLETGVPEATRLQAFGAGVMAEALDWGLAAATSDRLRQVLDRNVTTAGQAQARATLELERRRRAVAEGSILVAPQPAQELHDVIALTHAALGLSNARKRVRGWRLTYQTGKRPAYEQTFLLGAV